MNSDQNLHEDYRPEYRGEYISPEGILTNYEVCDILAEVVRACSVNPGEAPCGRKLIEICEREGLRYEIVPVANMTGDAGTIPGSVCSPEDGSGEKIWEAAQNDDARFNVMITLGAADYREKTHGLLIHGHYDTVPVLDMERPFETTITDNKMWGRGTVDQKGGLVAGLCAAIAMKRSGRKFKKPFCLAAVVDEESEHRGSYILGKSSIRADYAIVTEPTDTYRCEFGCRGTTPVQIRVKGKTAHAGTPWKGVNAIEKAMPILEKLFAMQFPEIDLGEPGKLKSTICVSLMQAGTAYNNVPNEAVISMDRRTIPGETNASALEEIHAVVEEIRKKDPSFQAEVEIARPDWKWEPIRERGLNPTITDADCPLYDVLARAAEKSGLDHVEKSLFEGYNDMDFLVNDLGIPTLVYGPGDAQMCHAPIEEVNIDEVCMVTEVFCHMIEELCGVSGDGSD